MLHLNTYVMGLLTFQIFISSSVGIVFNTSEFGVYGRGPSVKVVSGTILYGFKQVSYKIRSQCKIICEKRTVIHMVNHIGKKIEQVRVTNMTYVFNQIVPVHITHIYYLIFTHLKLCVAIARHNLKWVKIKF